MSGTIFTEEVQEINWTIEGHGEENGSRMTGTEEWRDGGRHCDVWTLNSPVFKTKTGCGSEVEWALTLECVFYWDTCSLHPAVLVRAVGGVSLPGAVALRCTGRWGGWEGSGGSDDVWFDADGAHRVELGQAPGRPLEGVLRCEVKYPSPTANGAKEDTEGVSLSSPDAATEQKSAPPDSVHLETPQSPPPVSAVALRAAPPQPLLQKLLGSMELADVVLNTKDKQLKAHSLVLSAKSKVLHAFFMAELKQGTPYVVDMQEFDSNIVKELLNFLYLNKIDNIEHIANDLLPLAFKFSVEELKEQCLVASQPRLTPAGAVPLLLAAHELGVAGVQAHAAAFIRRNYSAVSATDDWIKMRKYPKLLMNILV